MDLTYHQTLISETTKHVKKSLDTKKSPLRVHALTSQPSAKPPCGGRRIFTYRLRGDLSRPAAATNNIIYGLVCLFAIVQYLCLPIIERRKIHAVAC